MNEKKKIDKFLLEQPFRSKKRFIVGKISVFAALLILVITLILTLYYWNSLAWYLKLILGFIMLTLSPSIEDIKFLIMTYDAYKDAWEKHNPKIQ